MAKEPDQTRWVGIRPTDPAENIPVTESAPLTAIQVEPKPGSANFPVTESTPITQVKVEPVAVGTYFKTYTQKIAPAKADLQAFEALLRYQQVKSNVGAPNYTHALYTPPGGRLFVMDFLMGKCAQADPTNISFALRSGGVTYPFYSAAYGVAGEEHKWTDKMIFGEDEVIYIIWTGTLVTTDVTGLLFGYIVDKY